ncbi:methionyl-tRNA formyltransferase, partial [Candidatus Riesia pediculischaeffi]|uniref:methionyl-tRNA formyltransferase n=1 Tax=Candidatus Riesia pediculischaeffi TaxID=428411 RepID=UPI0018D2D20A
MKKLRIIFAGSSYFSEMHLMNFLKLSKKKLIKIVGILTTCDKPSGRGYRISFNPVKKVAKQYKIDCIQSNTLHSEAIYDWIVSKKSDIIMVAQYSLIFPKEILEVPRFGVWNIHCSLLPRWRGPSPIQYSILHGDKTSGVSIVQMDVGVDTGKIVRQSCCSISEKETFSSLYYKLSKISRSLVLESLKILLEGKINLKDQDEGIATYSKKIDKNMSKISWSSSALDIDRGVRAFQIWPISYFEVSQEVVKVLQTDVIQEYVDCDPGTILD